MVGLNDCSPVELLADAKAAGLAVSVRGSQLVVRGPRSAEGLVRQLLARKAELLPLVAGGPGRPEWNQFEADQLAREVRARLANVQREPAATWESVRCILLGLVQEAFDARDLPLLRERCKVARQIADGMPACGVRPVRKS